MQRSTQRQFGAAFSFAGQIMLNTGHPLLKWAVEPDADRQGFISSCLAVSNQMLLSYRRMTMERTHAAQDGFVSFIVSCSAPRCVICTNTRNNQNSMFNNHTFLVMNELAEHLPLNILQMIQ